MTRTRTSEANRHTRPKTKQETDHKKEKTKKKYLMDLEGPKIEDFSPRTAKFEEAMKEAQIAQLRRFWRSQKREEV